MTDLEADYISTAMEEIKSRLPGTDLFWESVEEILRRHQRESNEIDQDGNS